MTLVSLFIENRRRHKGGGEPNSFWKDKPTVKFRRISHVKAEN